MRFAQNMQELKQQQELVKQNEILYNDIDLMDKDKFEG